MPSRIFVANHTHLPELWQALNIFYLQQHLDWQSINDQLDQENILCLENNERLSALLSLSSCYHQTSWVKLFAVRNDRDAALCWEQLFIPSIERLRINTAFIDVYTIVTWDWYFRLIKTRPDFAFFLHIVTLECDPLESMVIGNTPVHVTRPFHTNDIEIIYAIDQAAFHPPWQLDFQNLTAACEQSTFARIIEIDDQVVGYILASSNDGSCHLSRIAIKPQFAGTGLGSLLLSELIEYCRSEGIQRITVNTQENNVASLKLYRKFGFITMDEKIPVFYSRQGDA
jgi:[ribosomal protein S18]-alanine N-acetyltransferase